MKSNSRYLERMYKQEHLFEDEVNTDQYLDYEIRKEFEHAIRDWKDIQI